MKIRRIGVIMSTWLALLAVPGAASAQENFPNRPVRIVVPYSPGSVTDVFARIVSSDLARAVGTAERLERATGAPLSFDPLLQERNFGDIRGTAYDDLGFELFAPDYAPPGGETWDVFHARVDRAWEAVRALAAATRGDLAVVTHGLVCRSLAGRHLSLADGEVVPERWENSSVTIVEGRAPWRVRLLNSIAHLEDPDIRPAHGSAV